ncbi:conjugal transfer protein TraD [Mesorhizobium sp. ESP7-2]|uniref:conjugal transfer protein TraD n=1 Tax=Mesorhizobium sp. ESP7-2 TaxID=2876622 RepID=UPI001CD01883|nr:conjugal transfer protein TraD [Mesorhizobium sp. ESP7-2]MBZ9709839.1 conjugal transfer protein TraD [Mesorhizobium sp. ESP7-2]
MAKTSLAERMSRLEQQKARLAEQEAKIKADERKQHVRRLIEAGTLIDKAGLLDLEPQALYGALLFLSQEARDEKQIAVWSSAGKKVLDREAKVFDATREPLTVTFTAALPTAFSTRLRGAGLRWNKFLQHWEGMADHEAVAALAAEQDGAVHRIGPQGGSDGGDLPDREKERSPKASRS